jgi:hypothetical protein
VAVLAPAYTPRRPTETALYGIVRDHLETFLRWARETYAKPLPRYVENELRAYLRCGVFKHGFVRCHCDACGHDLLVAYSCKSRALCPSCAGRRMANTAAFLVDRVLPNVPVRQYVLSLPFELRALAAFKANVLGALARIFVSAIDARYRGRTRNTACGAVTFVQRFGGSLNLNVHFHVVVLDGVFARDAEGRVAFSAAPAPTPAELDAIVRRVQDRSRAWLKRRGLLDERPLEERSNEASAPSAIDACAAIAMQRGMVKTLSAETDDVDVGDADGDHARVDKTALAEREGFNLHAGVRIEAADDLGRERLCRYGARPPLSLDRLRRLPGGRVAYRVKYVRRGRAKHRVMTAIELLARLSALIAPPRYPLVRYSGVLAPNSSWRKDVVPNPRASAKPCAPQPPVHGKAPNAKTRVGREGVRGTEPAAESRGPHDESGVRATTTVRDRDSSPPRRASPPAVALPPLAQLALKAVVELLAPNVLSVRHWERLLGGVLYASTPRIDWATLLRRTWDIDVLACAKCGGRLRVLGCITDPELARALLERLAMPTEAPRVARARDPTDDELTDDA